MPFLFMAARNQCINMKKIENRYDTFIDEQNTFFTENLQESKELAKLIDSALELLPEDHKDAFLPADVPRDVIRRNS